MTSQVLSQTSRGKSSSVKDPLQCLCLWHGGSSSLHLEEIGVALAVLILIQVQGARPVRVILHDPEWVKVVMFLTKAWLLVLLGRLRQLDEWNLCSGFHVITQQVFDLQRRWFLLDDRHGDLRMDGWNEKYIRIQGIARRYLYTDGNQIIDDEWTMRGIFLNENNSIALIQNPTDW